MLHLDEYCSKIPWIIPSHVPLKGGQSQGELVMTLEQELPQVLLSQGKLFQTELSQAELLQEGLPQAELPQAELPQAEMPQAEMPQGELTITLTAELSTEKLNMFPIILPDDLLGQAILLSLHDDEYVTAIPIPMSIQHNLDINKCSEEYSFLTIGCNYYANYIDLSKQEILEEDIGEQFFGLKAIVADHQALKPGDYACKGSLPSPMVI